MPYGATPSYDGETPVRAATAQYTYTFIGWTPDVAVVTGDVSYVAVYRQTVNTYTITWENWDGTELEVDENVPYGAEPSYDGATPTKAADAQNEYAFAGWTPAVAEVTGDAAYTATYTSTTNTYTVIWKNWDGTVLETDENVPYGATPSYDGATPTKEEDDQYTYTFAGWTPDVDVVTGDVIYTAKFDAEEKEVEPDYYTIVYTDGVEGAEIFENQVYYAEYGELTPEFEGTPKRAGYTFIGWEPEVETFVTEDAVYVAQWQYNINWLLGLDFGTSYEVKGLNTVDHVAYVVGRGNNKFEPNGTVTRAEAVTMFFRLLTDDFRNYYWDKTASYSDVNAKDWFNVAVATLEAAEIIQDTAAGGEFRPNEPITRAEMAVMAAQFCDVTGRVPLSNFYDVPNHHWAAKEIAIVENAGWIQGYNGYYRPEDTITRAECVTIINRMLERGAEADNMHADMVTFVDNLPGAWYYEAVQEAANSHTYVRTNAVLTNESFYGEQWVYILQSPNWAELEKTWAAGR